MALNGIVQETRDAVTSFAIQHQNEFPTKIPSTFPGEEDDEIYFTTWISRMSKPGR
jgi:hypothetical protein